MMMRILVPNLDKCLPKNPCIQVTMTPWKVIIVKIVFTLALPPVTLGLPPMPPLFMLPLPTTNHRHMNPHASSLVELLLVLFVVAASVHSSPPSTYFAHNFAHLEATILKQGQDIANISTCSAKLHAKLLPFCNILANDGE